MLHFNVQLIFVSGASTVDQRFPNYEFGGTDGLRSDFWWVAAKSTSIAFFKQMIIRDYNIKFSEKVDFCILFYPLAKIHLQ